MLKKGAYDLGRKAVYYIIVVFILFFMFVYVNNAVMDYQASDFKALENLRYLPEINKIKSCFYYKYPLSEKIYSDIDLDNFDKKTLSGCYDKPVKLKLVMKDKEIFIDDSRDYGGDFYEVNELVIARSGHNFFSAILKMEVAVYEQEGAH